MADQLSFVCAFLGGVSATILISVVLFSSNSKPTSLITISSALAACGFLIAVIASWRLIIGLHPDLPFVASSATLSALWRIMIGGYSIGVLSLIASVGVAGWIRSVKLGAITTFFSLIVVYIYASTSIYSG